MPRETGSQLLAALLSRPQRKFSPRDVYHSRRRSVSYFVSSYHWIMNRHSYFLFAAPSKIAATSRLPVRSTSTRGSRRWLTHFAAILIYDYFETLPHEISLFWHSERWTGATILFLVNRYLPLLNVVFALASYVTFTDSVSSFRNAYFIRYAHTNLFL